MTANFPATPSTGNTYSIGEYQYIWRGSTWTPLPERLNESVNNVTATSTSAVVDLSKGNYHKITSISSYQALSITFTNIIPGSNKWYLELDTNVSLVGWNNISTAVYDNVSFSVGTQDTVPYGIAFRPDGTKMYILGSTNDMVYQYTLSTAWNIATAVYDNISFSVAAQDANPTDIAFRPDGTRMYMLGDTNDRVYQYTLSTPWNLATAVYDNVSFLVSGQDTSPYGIAFRPDGTKMYVVGIINRRVYQYTLSTAWNLATAVYDGVFFSAGQEASSPTDIAFRPDGTRMYILGDTNDGVHQYTLSTAWNLATAVYDNISFSVGTQDSGPTGIAFRPDGTRMYVIGVATDRVHQYSLGEKSVSTSIWPGNIIWKNNTPPTVYDSQNLILEFYTNDGGTTIYGVEQYNRPKTF